MSMEAAYRALNRLSKWRTIFAGWQLGTRQKGDPEGDAVRDHREATINLRVEVNALTQLMVKKGVFTEVEFAEQLLIECAEQEKLYEKKFPGIKSNDHGLTMDPMVARETMKGWRP